MPKERMNREDLLAYIGCGIHTGLRKATDDPRSSVAHRAISEMSGDAWKAVIDFAFQDIQRVVWKKRKSK